MTPKQRILASLRGEKVDRIPWSPNLAYWWEHQDESITNRDEVEVLEEMGCDPLIRGHHPNPNKNEEWSHLRLFDTNLGCCQKIQTENNNEKIIKYMTPIGDLTAKYKLSSIGSTWFLCEHPVKDIEDYKKLKCLFDNITLTANFTRYEETVKFYGERAFIMPMLMPELTLKSSFQSLLEFWVGTEELIYNLYDDEEAVVDALESMKRVSIQAVEISSLSSAEAFITWEDTSTTNISPTFYQRYILPEINQWCDILHLKGKIYVQHACGHLKDVIQLMAQSKIDGIESISPPPTGNIELLEARKFLKNTQFLIGGIEPTVFLNSSLEELTEYTKKLIFDLKGTPFILANSDSCPPYVEYEKFLLISNIVKNN